MLELRDIKKDYSAGNSIVHALKGIDIQFRESEFVAILGPSGCGKTTMLNIIGGLDQYTSGDLIINGTSTKAYKDRDWDSYRNHSIGFVFQSYNLIPHQTVLQNVELALTLSGVSKRERRKRAKEALEMVGLGDQLRKRPTEMSGGQMQRVAIARALVNNPDIILADEPTGALDSETSVQVMDILKEVASDRLVIMVTHNPDLASGYATRIIKMLDGEVFDDTMPIDEDEEIELRAADAEWVNSNWENKKKMPSMSFFTSFGLSLKNLFTKKGRTLLTIFAGSIGIIGIALIYAVSNGMTNYINQVQEETLSSYPLTIEATTVDISTILQSFMGTGDSNANEHELDAVYSNPMMTDMIEAISNIETTENDLVSFKAFIEEELTKQDDEEEENKLRSALSGVLYTYNTKLNVYTKNVDGNIIKSDVEEVMTNIIYKNMGVDTASNLSGQRSVGMGGFSSMSTMSSNIWTEMLTGMDGELISPLIKNQYDLIYGKWPSSANEILLVVDVNNELPDFTLYALGLISEDEMADIFEAVSNDEDFEIEEHKWSYSDICNTDFKVILNCDCYVLDEESGNYTDLRDTEAGLKYLYDNAYSLKVSGIIKPNEDAATNMLTGAIAYTKLLTEYMIDKAASSDAVKAQLSNPHKDIFSGLFFDESEGSLPDKDKADYLKKYIADFDDMKKAASYVEVMSIPSQEQIDAVVNQQMSAMTTDDMKMIFSSALSEQMGMDESEIAAYVNNMSDEEVTDYFVQMMAEQVKTQMAEQVSEQMAQMPMEQLVMGFDQLMSSSDNKAMASYYDTLVEFSDSSYDRNLRKLGKVDLDDPSTVNLYASSFANKDVIEDVIAEYNENVDDLSKIQYTDYIGIILSSVTTIINVITYVLIAFVAISLVVSSIMIGVITLISVQERTKEIGILRAIGASKRNVSRMFNAETIIIGFASGVFGVCFTMLLCLPINAIIQKLTGIGSISAVLPINVAVVLVIISVLLTLFAGIIPSRSAAKKDPVVALRTE